MTSNFRKGDRVIWNRRLAVVRHPSGAGSRVWSSGTRTTPEERPPYEPHRVLVELLDGDDPPAGYSAWVPATELAPAPAQLELPGIR